MLINQEQVERSSGGSFESCNDVAKLLQTIAAGASKDIVRFNELQEVYEPTKNTFEGTISTANPLGWHGALWSGYGVTGTKNTYTVNIPSLLTVTLSDGTTRPMETEVLYYDATNNRGWTKPSVRMQSYISLFGSSQTSVFKAIIKKINYDGRDVWVMPVRVRITETLPPGINDTNFLTTVGQIVYCVVRNA